MKISEMKQIFPTSDVVDNFFYVEAINTNKMSTVSMSSVFDWTKQHSIENGLTVELRGDKIIFIKHK